MIDSVTLRLPYFIIYSDEFFTKAQHQELRGEFGVFGVYTTRYTTYAKRCAAEGRYFPQIHILERTRKTRHGMIPASKNLIVQVSLPKLVFGTNIFDMDERLLPLAAQKLVSLLSEIKIGVTIEEILNGIVTRIDYSKIIQVSPSFGTTDRILRSLAPYDIKQSSDFNRSHYHDGRDGFYMKFYNSSQGFVIYDKFDEIVTNGKTKLEQEIARKYKAGKWTKGALRIELSLQKKQTVDATLKQFSDAYNKGFTLRDVARTSIAKACLLRTFEDVYVKNFNRLVRLGGLKDTELLQIIEEHAPDFRERAILYYLAHRIRDHGLKPTIEDMKRNASPATIGRYKRLAEKILGEAEAKKDVVNPISYLHRKLTAFRPILPKQLDAILGGVADGEIKL